MKYYVVNIDRKDSKNNTPDFSDQSISQKKN